MPVAPSGSIRAWRGRDTSGPAGAVEIATAWLRYQPTSALSQWYHARFGGSDAVTRRIGIVAMARRLMIALWRYVTDGVIPEGAAAESVNHSRMIPCETLPVAQVGRRERHGLQRGNVERFCPSALGAHKKDSWSAVSDTHRSSSRGNAPLDETARGGRTETSPPQTLGWLGGLLR